MSRNMEAVLKKFDDALKCGICFETSKRPFTTGSCSHFFCQDCLLGLVQSICPKCGEPFYPDNITADTTVASILHEINSIAKIFESARSESNSLLDEVLHDIEHEGNTSNGASIKITEKENKKGSIYSKIPKTSTSVQNKNEIPKPIESAKKVLQDVNANSPVFESNEIQSVDMIGNSQSPIKKTGLCFPKKKIKNGLNKVKSNSKVNDSFEKFVGETNGFSPNKSSDSDAEFVGFPEAKNLPDSEGNSSSIKKSSRLKRKSSLIGIISKVGNSESNKENKLFEKMNSVGKANVNNEEELDDSWAPINSTPQNVTNNLITKIKNKLPLNGADKKTDDNLNKMKKSKKDSDSVVNENTPNNSNPADHVKRIRNNSLNGSVVDVKKFDYLEPLNDTKTQLKKRNYSGLGKLNNSITKEAGKSSSLIKVRKSHNKEPKNVSQFDNDSSEIIPATPQDAAVGLVVDAVSARGRKHSISLNVNSTKRRDSVKRNKKGETPLLAACAKGNLAEVQKLIREGSDPNIKDYAGWTPMHEAVLKGNLEIVEALVEAGANINTPGHFNITPLLEAVLQNNYPIVSFLLRNGADRSLRSRYNYRPLDCAQGEEMTKLLNLTHPTELATKEATTNYCMPDPFCLCPINLDTEQSQTLRDFCIKFNLKCVESLRPEVTHAIVVTEENSVCKTNFNVLKCLANGTAVISFNWIEHSLKSNEMTKPDVWEVHGTEEFPNSEAFMKSRINAQKLLPKLLDGLHVSLSHNWAVWKELKKNHIVELVQEAGAVVLHREPDPESIPADEKTVMFHAASDGVMGICSHVSLYVPGVKEPLLKYNMKHVKTLSVEWIVDCIQSFKILDPKV